MPDAVLNVQPLDRDEADRLAGTMKVLADPTRLQILNLLYAHPRGLAVSALHAMLGRLTQPTMSHHMGILRRSGLVDVKRSGVFAVHTLNHAAMRQLSDVLRPGSRRR